MRILLDECLPQRLRGEILGHDVFSVRERGWLGIKNGKLLKLMGEAGDLDVFVTMDRNLAQQQSIHLLRFAIVVLRAHSNRLEDTKPLMPELIRRLPELKAGRAIEIGTAQ